MTRLASTAEAARRLGFITATGEPKPASFLRWARARKDKGFPWPAGRHGLWWDMKAIDQYLDKTGGIQPQSSEPDYAAMFREDLHGEHQGALPH